MPLHGVLDHRLPPILEQRISVDLLCNGKREARLVCCSVFIMRLHLVKAGTVPERYIDFSTTIHLL